MAKMRISPELKKLIEKYRCVKDTEGMSPAKVYKLVGENENLYLKMTDSRYKGTTYDVEREKDMMLMASLQEILKLSDEQLAAFTADFEARLPEYLRKALHPVATAA